MQMIHFMGKTSLKNPLFQFRTFIVQSCLLLRVTFSDS